MCIKLNVEDNQYVEKGTVLVEIDPADYEVAVAQARAEYADAQAQAAAAGINVPITDVSTASQVSGAQGGVSSAQAAIAAARQQFEAAKSQVAEAEANNTKAQNDLVRYKQLIDKQEISQQQYDQAVASAQAAAATCKRRAPMPTLTRRRSNRRRASWSRPTPSFALPATAPQTMRVIRARAQSAQANAEQKKAELDQAELNLQYTKVIAPVSGAVSNRTVEVGQNVQPGQEMMKVIPLDEANIWVTANFKETQLRKMKPGQPAEIAVDANGRTYKGHVDSIAGASGARFSLLPPENATGNYVKVVQRIPVKIVFDKGEIKEHELAPACRSCRRYGLNRGLDQIMGAATLTMNDAAEWRSAVNPWVIAMAVTLATFMEVLDTSIANVALPHVAGSLSAGQDESTWILTSYLVSNAIVLPLSGWLSSIVGRKYFYMGCVAIFTISSFLCGFAPNLGMLIFFRILQGAGGGGLQPSSQAILADTFPPAKRGMAFAVYGIAVVMAPAVGPTLGGWITDNFSWRWIFFINIPVGILSLLLTQRLIQDPPYLRRRKLSETKIDYIGLGLIALGLGTLQVILDKGQREDWFESHFIVGLTVISAVSLIFVIFWEWNHKDPIVELHLFRERTFAAANFLMFMLGFALLGSTLLLPLFMQTLLGYTAERSGMALSPGGFAIMLMMPLVGFLLSRYSPRWLMVFGLAMLSFSLFHMTTFDLSVDFRTMIMARVYQADWTRFPVRAHQHRRLCVSAAREEQCRVRFDEPRQKYRRQRRDFFCHHRPGSPRPVPSGAVGGEVERRQSAVSVRAARDDGCCVRAAASPGQVPAPGTAQQHAYAMLQGNVIRQATMLAYIDNFWVLGVAILCLIPCVFLIKKQRPGGEIVAH